MFVFAVLLVGSGGVTAPEARADGLPVLRGWRLAETQGFHPSPRDSGSVFAIPGADTFGVFGGVSEAIDISGATQPTANTYFNDIFLFHGPTRTWTRRSTGAGPAPRAFTCAVYHEVTNSVFVFGGADFAADFSAFTFFDDLWSFDLATDTWTEIEPPGPGPSARGAFGCDLIGDAIFVFSGNGLNFSTDNELWRYDINAGSWTLLQADDPDDDSRPSARTQMTFARIPGQDELLLAGGDGFEQIPEPPFLVAITQEDVWVYEVSENSWTELAVDGKPEPARIHQAFEMTSGRFLFVQNGDAQGDKTVEDTCPPPLFCLVPATPTNDTFVYDTGHERWTQLNLLLGSVPPTRRSMIGRVGETLYLFGGYGWNGANAVGKIANPYTWELKLGLLLAGD